MYNIFRHAFLEFGQFNEGETEGDFDGAPIEQYADTIVNDLLTLGIKNIETEAALVLNVWMVCVHELFQVLEECKADDSAKGIAALDKFAALWIGDGQVEGSNDEGHMLYNLAETAGERFGQDNGETMVNMRIVERMGQLHTMLTSRKCTTADGHQDMRPIVKEMIGVMTIPLVQNLIHYAANLQDTGGSNFVELYALATIPRVAACDPAAYDKDLHLDVLRKLEPNQVHDAIESIQKSFDCFDITCAQVGSYLGGTIPQCQDATVVTVAEYSTDREDASRKVKLDRDIKMIDIFLRFAVYGVADDWYRYGWNSNYALKDLATNQVIPSLPSATSLSYIDIFQDYYGDSNFADTLITSILEQVPPYNSATNDQIRMMVVGVLQHVIVFMTSASSLQYAIEMCSVDTSTALQYWDTGALLYVGSMEAPTNGGSLFGGEFLYSDARELCSEFNTCVVEADANGGLAVAAANDVAVQAFVQGVEMIEAGSCDSASGLLILQLLASMAIPLIQGTIKYASYNAGLPAGTVDSSLAIGDTFARAILPLVEQVDRANANVIARNTIFQLSTQPVPEGFPVVSRAMRTALGVMPTSCADVGNFEDEPSDGKMCQGTSSGEQSPVVGQSGTHWDIPTTGNGENEGSLTGSKWDIPSTNGSSSGTVAFGRYSFSNYGIAEQDAAFALDVRGIFQAASIAEAQSIYINGSSERGGNLSGDSGLTTLASFSREVAEKMADDPMFNIFRYALYDDSEFEEGTAQEFVFADNVVTEAFEQGQDQKLAAEASVVMNIWMVIVHRLYEASRQCYAEDNVAELIDSAVALWVGKDQEEGKFERGWGLYSVGQSAAEFYGLEEKEASVNSDIMRRFNEAQSLAKRCHEGQHVAQEMYFEIQELIRVLSKPLILNLLFHLVSDSRNMMDLYAAAVVPQAMACHDEVGANLQRVLFSPSYTSSDLTDNFLDDLVRFLQCQRITVEDLQHTNAVPGTFLDLLDSISTRLQNGVQPRLAGYNPLTDISEIVRLDLDIQEVKIMMRTQAYAAAALIYQRGHNSFDATGHFLSLQHFAKRTSFLSNELPSEVYSSYYNVQFVADDVLMKAFSKAGDFVSATRGELAEIAVRTLQSMVSYDAVWDQMKRAQDYCIQENASASLQKAKEHWDRAVSLFVGSQEGPDGRGDRHGSFLYGLSKSICADFGTCEASGDSRANQKLLVQFTAGRSAIADEDCQNLRRVGETISTILTSILIQSTLSLVLHNDSLDTSRADTIGSVYILAKSVIPFVAQSDATSAEILESTLGNFGTLTNNRPVPQIFQAFANALPGMGIDCSDIGIPAVNPSLLTCDNMTSASTSLTSMLGTPINLGDGLYVTTTYVQPHANIGNDVADIEEAIKSGNFEAARLQYRDGKNSKVYDEHGMFQHLRSLKSFSVTETLDMEDEPIFSIFKYALEDNDGSFLSNDVRLYADSIVERSFTHLSEKPSLLPVEAILSLNMWMHIVHILYETLEQCKNKQIYDGDGVHSLDIAVAYWIGDGQVNGSSTNGHLLYALTERAGESFDMGLGAAQSRTNTNILMYFNAAKDEMALPGACSENPSSYLRLSNHVHRIVSLMAVPLIQTLVDSLWSNDRDRVEIYSSAFVPLTASCNPETFQYLKEKLLSMTYNVAEIDTIVEQLQSTYPCLGLTCSDVGVHASIAMTGASSLQCQDPQESQSLAAGIYQPFHSVASFAQLDLDMRQMDILLQMEAFNATKTLYTYGRHSPLSLDADGTVSLFQLASSSQRHLVPEFELFIRYYRNMYEDPSTYADQIIRSALNATSGYQWTPKQRTIIAMKSMQVLVMYFATLEPLYEAVESCLSGDNSGGEELWDQGAAFWIGSLAGGSGPNATQSHGGGYFLLDLAREHCQEFGTCLPDGFNAEINDQLLSLWYAGRGALSNSCSTARATIAEISNLLLIPILQGALSSAVHLHDEAANNRAQAYVYSRALLPFVASVNTDAAKVINQHLGFPGPSSTRHTVDQVFTAFAEVYNDLNIDCTLIGTIDGLNPCDGAKPMSSIWKWVGIALGGAIALCAMCACLKFRRKAKVTKRLPENNPRFVFPETGELNHSMDLLEKAFAKHHNRITPTTTKHGEMAPLTKDMYTDASSSGGDDDNTSSASDSSSSRSNFDHAMELI